MAGRIETVVKALEQARLDALVAFTTSFHSFLETDGVLLLSGFKPMGESAALIARSRETAALPPCLPTAREPAKILGRAGRSFA